MYASYSPPHSGWTGIRLIHVYVCMFFYLLKMVAVLSVFFKECTSSRPRRRVSRWPRGFPRSRDIPWPPTHVGVGGHNSRPVDSRSSDPDRIHTSSQERNGCFHTTRPTYTHGCSCNHPCPCSNRTHSEWALARDTFDCTFDELLGDEREEW
jgi:hypothetical protein